MLYEKISNDMKIAMKNQDKDTLSTLRMLKSAIDALRIDKKLETVTDEIVIDACSKQVKTHKESIDMFEKAGRDDLVNGLKKEIELLQSYMPEQLSDEELEKEIDRIFDVVKPTSRNDMGMLMKEANLSLKGKADFKKVSEIIQSKLNF